MFHIFFSGLTKQKIVCEETQVEVGVEFGTPYRRFRSSKPVRLLVQLAWAVPERSLAVHWPALCHCPWPRCGEHRWRHRENCSICAQGHDSDGTPCAGSCVYACFSWLELINIFAHLLPDKYQGRIIVPKRVFIQLDWTLRRNLYAHANQVRNLNYRVLLFFIELVLDFITFFFV